MLFGFFLTRPLSSVFAISQSLFRGHPDFFSELMMMMMMNIAMYDCDEDYDLMNIVLLEIDDTHIPQCRGMCT